MKLLIMTRSDSEYKPISDLTHPIIKWFAKKWDADFLVLNKDANCVHKWGRIHYRIMESYDLLKKHDRVLNIDSDIVINENCPNLFEIVPNDMIGVVFEDKGSRLRDRRRRIHKIQAAWGDIGWREGYINTGVFLVSRSHKEIFKKFNGNYWPRNGFDDVHLGYQIRRLDLKIFELDWRFNHTSMFSEKWNDCPSRFDSYIIHYAGQGMFPDKGSRSRIQLIKDDIKKIYGENT